MRFSEQFLSREDFALGDGAPWCTEGTLTRLFILVFTTTICLAQFLNLDTLGRITFFVGGCLMRWRKFSSIPGFRPLDASGVPQL